MRINVIAIQLHISSLTDLYLLNNILSIGINTGFIFYRSKWSIRFMKKYQFEKHSGILLANDLKQIALPLAKVGINYFSYTKVENGKDFYAMTTNVEWSKKYLQEEYYNLELPSVSNLKVLNYPKILILWDAIENNKNAEILKKAAAEFNFAHVLSVIEVGNNFYNSYCFGASPNNDSINQFYYNNLDMLNAFILYFKEKLYEKSGLARIPQTKIIIEKNDEISLKLPLSLNQRMELFQTVKNNKLIISEFPNIKYITPREMQVLHYLSQGNATPQIAEIMKISKRTAEEHITNIKCKLSCKTLFQLGEKLATILPKIT